MQEAPQERTTTNVIATVSKDEFVTLFSLFSEVTANADFLRPNLVYRFFYSVTENEDDLTTHALYMEKLDGVARTKEQKELLCGGESVELFSFRPNLIEFLTMRALNQMSNRELNTLLFKEGVCFTSGWLKNTQTNSFVVTTEATRQQEQPLEIIIYGFYGETKYL